MSEFEKWCDDFDEKVGDHELTLLTTDAARLGIGLEKVAAVVPSHYASDKRLASILEKLGKPEAAKYLEGKLPSDKKARSGDLGEILAISFIKQRTIFDQTVMKLRWKDSRNMALRGDDLLAVGLSNTDQLLFLKGESKSRLNLSASPITDARNSLNNYDGLPNPHSLTFLADRMAEEGRTDISDRIDAAQLSTGIHIQDVTHMTFTFSANDPRSHLWADLAAYDGEVEQWSVGLRIESHQEFIKAVFDKVIADGIT